MTFQNSHLRVVTLCSFVCFHVTADFNLKNELGDHSEFHSKRSVINEDSRQKRTNYQEPPVLGSASPLVEDWIPDSQWPKTGNIQLGQVGGVSINKQGDVVVFHRGDHVWGSRTFDRLNVYNEKDKGPISVPTVLVFDADTGTLLHQWGENMFYLPHGITVDKNDNLWLTDVALHQVFKFPPLSQNQKSPLLTLGKAFTPGNSAVRFCKPTSVAITSWGDFFVADGYCNSRLIKFNKAGEKILEIGRSTNTWGGLAPPSPYSFAIPHALTLAEDRKLVCIADRENGRALCFDWTNGTFVFQISSPQIGSLIYSVAYTPADGGLFFVVNGQERMSFNPVPVRGYVISASNLRLLSYFGPELKMPHDMAVSVDGRNVFVGEIGPNLMHKYMHNGSLGLNLRTTEMSKTAPELIAPISPQSLRRPISVDAI